MSIYRRRRRWCRCLIIFLLLMMVLYAADLTAGHWPQWLGPSRDGHAAADEHIVSHFGPDGPPVVWETQIGEGVAGPAVADGRLVVVHRAGDEIRVDCLDAATGERIWRYSYPTDYRDDFGFNEGPRAVPTIAGGRVYTYGPEGILTCLGLHSGEQQWSVDTAERFDSDKGFFGRACSPLIEGNLVVLNIGGRDGAGVVAFDRQSGEVAWKATDHEAGYASPVAATIHGQRHIISLTREGLVGLSPDNGQVFFEHPFRSGMNASVNAATPLVLNDRIFLSACYGTGAALLRLTEPGELQEVWASDEALSNHYATSVHHKGHLYGFHGRQDIAPPIRLRCIRLSDGQQQWEAPRMGAGSVLFADDKLIVLTERGELLVAPAMASGFKPNARAQVMGLSVRAYPALANGIFYARDQGTLFAFDLRPKP